MSLPRTPAYRKSPSRDEAQLGGLCRSGRVPAPSCVPPDEVPCARRVGRQREDLFRAGSGHDVRLTAGVPHGVPWAGALRQHDLLHEREAGALHAPEAHEVEPHVGRRDDSAGQEHRLVGVGGADAAPPSEVTGAGSSVVRDEVGVLLACGGAQRAGGCGEVDVEPRADAASGPCGSVGRRCAMAGAEGRPAASRVIRTTRPSRQQLATSEPASGATATWHTDSPASTGAPSGSEGCLARAPERLHGAGALEGRVDDLERRVIGEP